MIPISYNVRSLMVRKTTTIATALGIGLVVFVLASSQMLARGIRKTMAQSGSEGKALVLRKGAVEPGAKTFGRVLLVVSNGKALAERVVAAGYPMDRPLAATTNFVRDPDGYLIELYQRPAAPAPK